jgi:hypothetical protein
MPRNKLDLDPLVKALQKQKKTLPIKVGETKASQTEPLKNGKIGSTRQGAALRLY